MKYEIGQVLATDKTGFEQTLSVWNNKIVPALRGLIEEYDTLGIGAFSQDEYDEILTSGISDIEARYVKLLENEVNKLKVKVLVAPLMSKESIGLFLKSFRAKAAIFLDTFQRAHEHMILRIAIHKEDCKIVNGLPTILNEQIEKRFQTTIENEDQLQILQMGEAYIEKREALQNFIKDKLPGITYEIEPYTEMAGRDSVTIPGDDGRAVINPSIILYFK